VKRAVLPALVVALAVNTYTPQPWRLLVWVVLAAGFVAAAVYLIRGVLRYPNFVADPEGYERPGTTPARVREPGVIEGTVVQQRRPPRG
jgi:predicted DCC family thiol-disulfide oxidoreductase YuxK